MQTQPRATSNDDLQATKRQFSRWRTTHLAGTRIPDRLWRSAANAANEHGLSCTARTLGLDYNRLKERAALASRSNADPASAQHSSGSAANEPAEARSGFVEFSLSSPPGTTSCVAEIEGTNALKLRLDLKGYAASEVDVILRAAWDPSRCCN